MKSQDDNCFGQCIESLWYISKILFKANYFNRDKYNLFLLLSYTITKYYVIHLLDITEFFLSNDCFCTSLPNVVKKKNFIVSATI